jgi:hypothetical protein
MPPHAAHVAFASLREVVERAVHSTSLIPSHAWLNDRVKEQAERRGLDVELRLFRDYEEATMVVRGEGYTLMVSCKFHGAVEGAPDQLLRRTAVVTRLGDASDESMYAALQCRIRSGDLTAASDRVFWGAICAFGSRVVVTMGESLPNPTVTDFLRQ